MNTDAYPACIRDLYESEILGEAVFLALVAIARNPREKYQLGTLLQLETETKARLRPFLFRHAISLDENMDLAGVAVVIEGYQALSWPEFAAANVPVVQGFLAIRGHPRIGPSRGQENSPIDGRPRGVDPQMGEDGE